MLAFVTFGLQIFLSFGQSWPFCVYLRLHFYIFCVISLGLNASPPPPPPPPLLPPPYLVFTRMMVTGYKRPLVEKDLWSLNPEDCSQRVVPQLVCRWNTECQKVKRSGVQYSREWLLHENLQRCKTVGLFTQRCRIIAAAMAHRFSAFGCSHCTKQLQRKAAPVFQFIQHGKWQS